MENSEHQIGVVRVSQEGLSRTYYDLYVTDKRMIFVHLPYRESRFANQGIIYGGILGVVFMWFLGLNIGFLILIVGVILGGLIGEGLDRMIKSKNRLKEQELSGLTLAELLEKREKSLIIAYKDIKQAKLSARAHALKIILNANPNVQGTFSLKKDQFKQLSTILPSITPLKGKLVS